MPWLAHQVCKTWRQTWALATFPSHNLGSLRTMQGVLGACGVWTCKVGSGEGFRPSFHSTRTGSTVSLLRHHVKQLQGRLTQAIELVKAKMKLEFGPDILDMLNAISECTRKISEDPVQLSSIWRPLESTACIRISVNWSQRDARERAVN